ncbi:hypothetical protein [Paraburkholderia pallida]|uniref:Uncharacterized protein n=1 Tax=Paraburkholderia pallida TaxID=2547399 RepID=A0A4P7DAM4_9BURK|nr:hypothetical protein [Paraburkholderia pallida]QBR04270.1 hypothetical protein E1956_44935 [Paraburkholderia pallida]
MKNLLFERHIGASAEQVGVRLYRVATGFIAERFVVQGNQMVAVQVLPMFALADFEGFALSDPHYLLMRAIYGEVRQLVWGSQG